MLIFGIWLNEKSVQVRVFSLFFIFEIGKNGALKLKSTINDETSQLPQEKIQELACFVQNTAQMVINELYVNKEPSNKNASQLPLPFC